MACLDFYVAPGIYELMVDVFYLLIKEFQNVSKAHDNIN